MYIMHGISCTLDPNAWDRLLTQIPLLQSERTQGFAADPVYVKGEVFAYVGLPQNLKDLKDPFPRRFVSRPIVTWSEREFFIDWTGSTSSCLRCFLVDRPRAMGV